MVWPAVLLVLLLVLGRGEAYSELRCHEDESDRRASAAAGYPVKDELSRRGLFVDPDRQTRVFLRILPNEKRYNFPECFLQHEDGPVHSVGLWDSEFVGFVALCRDPVSGRDHVVVSKTGSGSGSIPSNQYWSVHPDTQQLTLEYQENPIVGEDDPEFGPRSLVGADGQCQWRQQKAARGVFDDAMAVLRNEIKLEDEALDVAVGDSLTLPTRAVSAETVQHWLHALRTQATAFATIETLNFGGHTPWRLVQILGRELCSAPGVVLLHDTRSGQWHSLYAVHSGCSKALNFPLQDMVITDDTLLASACTDSHYWGAYGAFAIDLKTHRITRVDPAEESW